MVGTPLMRGALPRANRGWSRVKRNPWLTKGSLGPQAIASAASYSSWLTKKVVMIKGIAYVEGVPGRECLAFRGVALVLGSRLSAVL